MAITSNIRKRTVLILIIGLALFAFVISSFNSDDATELIKFHHPLLRWMAKESKESSSKNGASFSQVW